MVWVEFFVSALFIVVAGTRLSYYGDIIAEKSKLGRSLVGLLLISFATSLPEVVTSIRAATLGNPDLVMGNMFGSNLFNLSILIVMDMFLQKQTIYSRVDNRTLQSLHGSMLLVIVLLFSQAFTEAIVGHGFVYEGTIISMVRGLPMLFHIGFDTLLVFILYFVLLRKMFLFEEMEAVEELQYEAHTLRHGITGFAVCAAIIIVAGVVLTRSADQISRMSIGGAPLGGTFVGSLFMAIVTSLPELVATLGAIKIGAYNMAIGNVVGSNVFNITILFLGDLFYTGGSLTVNADRKHLLTALVVLAMSMLVATGSLTQKDKRFRLSSISLLIALLYLGTQYILFWLR